MNWKILTPILPVFPNLTELILCKNDMSDTENICINDTLQ